ncbi:MULTISPECIES: SulP family inorganic anion transporter [unclassified Nocardioides]|uniref:SulP family inorganic anion transporter n=1 Tax=unclassified Nocardioides TaxID=2615069 RepID=UPI0009F0049A|nr:MULTISPECIES: SulP family inorganic anion transporter [unclassified Nocardioides]GAW50125.1 sulfate permease [Nocardioides sp. PD653-B2]GAW54810.1 sulfate permease [Nocardioides sp. PD653]
MRVRRVTELLPRAADWRQARVGADLTAGLMVGLVALPLALGFGASSGLGAGAGLVTAIVAGVVAAVFGGSRFQVSGPTGAMTVVLVPIVATHGPDGVLVVGLLAGLLLVGLGVAGAGRFIRYVPISVVEGFTVGIAAIIALQQVPSALGVRVEGTQVLGQAGHAVVAWVEQPTGASIGIAAAVAVAVLGMARLRPGLPWSLIAVVAATVANSVAGLGATSIGHIPSGLPAPSLPTVPVTDLGGLLLPAVAVAGLAALESLLSATVADGMSVGGRHDSDRELVGQGLANVAAPLFGGIPATAAIARTAVNVRSGAVSRLAAVTHALVLLLIVLVAARWVGEIPRAALAGVLIATAVQMVRVSSLMALARATRGDAAVVVVTAVATVVVDLVTAVVVGLVVAGFLALRQTALSARLDEVPLDDTDHADEERSLLDQHIVAFRIDGPLFFAAAHDFLLELAEVSDVRVVVLRMSRVSTIDATGASVLADTITRLEDRGIAVLLSGLRPDHERILRGLGVHHRLTHERHLFATTPEAIAHARLHAARVTHTPDDETVRAAEDPADQERRRGRRAAGPDA